MRHIKKLATRIGNKGTQITNTEILKKETPKITIQKSVVVSERIESPTPVINILTRTSNRPNGFKRCRESIVNQTYKNIRHLVSIDNLNDEEYVKSHNVEYFFMDKEAISKEPDIPDPKTGNRFIYNLYLNHLINQVKEGWVFILDDDDYFADNNCVQKMVNAVKNTTDIVLWQMKYPNGQTLPSLQELGAPPKLARISSQCFMVHSGIAKIIRWDGWKCGDFRFVQKAYAKTGEKRVIREVLVNLGGAGLGMKKDIAAPNRNINLIFNDMNKKPSQEIDANSVIASFRNKFANKLKSTSLEIDEPENINKVRNGITILITAYKTSEYIEQCLDSIYKQTYFKSNYDYEVIVGVDGCVNTYNKIKNIKHKYHNLNIAFFKENKGAYVTMNSILPLSTYDNILRFDSDDIMAENMISTLMNVSNEYDIVRFNFYNFNTKTPNQKTLGHIPAVGVIFIKKHIYDIAGGYENYRFSADSEFLKRTDKFTTKIILDDRLFYYRRHDTNLTSVYKGDVRKKIDDKIKETVYTEKNLKITPVTNNITEFFLNKKYEESIRELNYKLKQNLPFSLVRYGDGEMDIINNKDVDLSKKFNGEHVYNSKIEKYQKLRNELINSLKYKSNNYYVGLPCPCCVANKNVENMLKISNQNLKNVTWANIFSNFNYTYFSTNFMKSLEKKEIVLICNKNADLSNISKKYNITKVFKVGKNAWFNDYNTIKDVVNYSKNVNPNTVFLFSSGTFTKITIHKIHQLRNDLFLIDTGSTLDKMLNLGITRNYLTLNHKNNNKKCLWVK